MKVLIFAALLLATCLSFSISPSVAADGKVKIDFFYESLCPYCQQFIQRSLKVAANTKVKKCLNSGFLEDLRFQSFPLWKC